MANTATASTSRNGTTTWAMTAGVECVSENALDAQLEVQSDHRDGWGNCPTSAVGRNSTATRQPPAANRSRALRSASRPAGKLSSR